MVGAMGCGPIADRGAQLNLLPALADQLTHFAGHQPRQSISVIPQFLPDLDQGFGARLRAAFALILKRDVAFLNGVLHHGIGHKRIGFQVFTRVGINGFRRICYDISLRRNEAQRSIGSSGGGAAGVSGGSLEGRSLGMLSGISTGGTATGASGCGVSG